MRILLITPRNPKSFWTFHDSLPLLDKRCLLPNLSMPTVAGMTPREHEILLCDENVEEIDFDLDADIVGITGYIVHRERVREIAREFRARGRYVVIGGPYASLCPDDLRADCDTLFVGEAEETWPKFLEDFAAGRHQKEYEAAEKPDMTLSPKPRFDLMKVDRYQTMTIQFGRGCPFRCEFCDIIVVYGRRPRIKEVDQLLSEIEDCYSLGVRQIFIADDNFIGNKPHAKALLRRLASWGRERGYPISFGTELSVNVAQDDELLELLRQANMTTVFLGIESPRAASLQETKKLQNVRGDLISSVHKIQSYGIQVQAGMIVGFDADDVTIFDDQLAFLTEARIPLVMMGMLQALPRTPLYRRVQAEGRLLPETTSATHSLGLSNIEPINMSRLDLLRGYRRLIRDLYSLENFGNRARAFIRSRGEQVERASTYNWNDIKVIIRFALDTLFKQPPEKRRFIIDLIRDTLRERPKAFREAASFILSQRSLGAFAEELGQKLDQEIELLEKEEARSGSWQPRGKTVMLGGVAGGNG